VHARHDHANWVMKAHQQPFEDLIMDETEAKLCADERIPPP